MQDHPSLNVQLSEGIVKAVLIGSNNWLWGQSLRELEAEREYFGGRSLTIHS